MTVSSTTTKVSYSGNGSTTVFAYGFKIFADADLRVIERAADGTETVKSLTTHYTVSGAGSDSGGNVTFGTAPASGVTVIIKRNLTLTQGTDYVANDPFPAESHEEALDRLTFITQGIQEELDRAIKASETNTLTGAEFTISATDRANKVFSFDASGNLAVTQELGTFKGDWAASTTYAVRDLVKDTSTNNIFIVTEAHTSSGSQPLTTNANSAKYSLIVDAATATSAQTAAASSASSASTSASTATTKASEAATSASASAASATAASASETASAASETASAASETASAASETASAASQTAAAASASSASTSASTATTKASEASTSAATATTKASEAAASQSAAASSESSASTSAATATTKAAEASTSASNSASSATASASSATAAAASQTAAAASAASAATAFDNFDDRFLGSKTGFGGVGTGPSVDNDGNALITGSLFFSADANEMRVFDGANFIAATSAGNVSLILYEYTATSNQTTFSGSDNNSATLSYTAGNLQVVMNGVILDPSDFTATSGTSVVLASGAATGDLINIYAFKSFTTADMVSKSAGGTFAGAVGFSGGITGDVAFDTNTLKVDSSNNRIGIGVSAPSSVVDIKSSGATSTALRVLKSSAAQNLYAMTEISGHGRVSIFDSSENEDIRLDTNGVSYFNGGNVGINNASPSQSLHVHGAAEFNAHDNTSGSGGYNASGLIIGNAFDAGKGSSVTDDRNSIIWNERGLDIDFATSNTYRMKIDSVGHVLFGQSSTDSPGVGNTTAGATIRSTGRIFASASGAGSSFNRNTSDGAVIEVRKAGTLVGVLGVTDGDNFSLDCQTSAHAGLTFGSANLVPRLNGSQNDGNVDLGAGGARFLNIYATNATIQTSDESEKQNIAALTSAEITAAKAISKLFKTFKWKHRVSEEGDAARTHTGVIAQEVQAAMTDAGLDASKYAFWCSDTWWEHSVDVAAVEADEEAGVEAKDAYTRIDTYDTKDEAPTGATERTRLGVRYAELMSFVGAATEQRLTDIETRLTALEAGS